MFAYYEPVKNKIYIANFYQGKNPKKLLWASDSKFYANWTFSKPEYKFYYLGEV